MLSFKNYELKPFGEFLANLQLKNKASRARSKLVQKIESKLQEYSNDQNEIIEKYGEHDDSGNLIRDGNGQVIWRDGKINEVNKALQELNEEQTYLNIDEYRPNIKFLTVALDSLDQEFSAQEATIYDRIMDILEEETKEKED
ncbi:MAG: DUF1617 family protein [Streptococcaceae bacterium]|jgi:hypothetical protein|nr:DUF1617 family protein [Streptococcaceae bacterium]